MYRRLETKPVKMEAEDSKSEAECSCSCGSAKATDNQKQPEANTAANQMAAYIKING